MTPKAEKAMTERPETRPSKPSVKLTALEKPTNQNKIKITKNQPRSTSIFVNGILSVSAKPFK